MLIIHEIIIKMDLHERNKTIAITVQIHENEHFLSSVDSNLHVKSDEKYSYK